MKSKKQIPQLPRPNLDAKLAMLKDAFVHVFGPEIALGQPSKPIDPKTEALRAALSVMVRAEEYEYNMDEACPHCFNRVPSNHDPKCHRVSAIKLARSALGE